MSYQKLIQPVTVERDADGYWSHPGIPSGNNDAFNAWMESQELVHHICHLDSEDESLPAYHAYYENGVAGVAIWNPAPPEGNGWFTFSIHETEDGPVWVWVRRIAELEESPQIDATAVSPEEFWSADNEEFNFSTLGDLCDNHDLNVGDTVYVGESRKPSSPELCDADDIIEMMGERASDIAGEYAEGYPDVTDEAKADLDNFLKEWIEKHASPSFYTVSNVRPYILSANDFESIEVAV